MEDIYDIPMSSFILSSLKIHYIPKRFTTYPYINAKEEIPYRYVPWIAERIISIRYLLNTCSNEDSICIKAYICNRCSFHENPHMSYTDLIQFTLNEYIKFINSHINICDGESKFDSELREWYHKNKAQLHEDLKKEYKRLYMLERFNPELITDIYKLIEDNKQSVLKDVSAEVLKGNKFMDSTTKTQQITNEKIQDLESKLQESNNTNKTLIFNTIKTLTDVNHVNYLDTTQNINNLNEKIQDLETKLQESNNIINKLTINHANYLQTTNEQFRNLEIALESLTSVNNKLMAQNNILYDKIVRLENPPYLFLRNILQCVSIVSTIRNMYMFIQNYIHNYPYIATPQLQLMS